MGVSISTVALGAEIKPSLDVGLIKTDNLALAAVDPEEATIWELSPAIDVKQKSVRLDADVVYRATGYHYQERGENEVFNQLDSQLRFGAVPDKLFIEAGASRAQSIIDPESTIPINNLAISTNRVDRDEYYFGPAFKVGAGGDAIVNGSLRRTWVNYADPLVSGIQDYDYDAVDLSVDNYHKRRGVTWAARYRYDYSDFGPVIPPYEFRQESLEIGFWASKGTRLFAVGGEESPWDKPFEPAATDPFWEVGVARDLGDQLTAEFAFGERTYGPSRRGKLDYKFGHAKTLLVYEEQPRTTASDRSTNGSTIDPTQPPDYLFRAGSLERYISKRLEWDFDMNLTRLNVHFMFFDESREQRKSVIGTPLPDETQSGGTFTLGWKLGARTTLNFNASRSDVDFATGIFNKLTQGSFTAGYKLGPRTNLSLELARWRQESDDPGVGYRVNLATLLLSRSFR